MSCFTWNFWIEYKHRIGYLITVEFMMTMTDCFSMKGCYLTSPIWPENPHLDHLLFETHLINQYLWNTVIDFKLLCIASPLLYNIVCHQTQIKSLTIRICPLKRFMIMRRMLHNGSLASIFIYCNHSRFTLVQAGTGTRPIHPVTNWFIFCKTKFANFQFSTSSASRYISKIIWKRREEIWV